MCVAKTKALISFAVTAPLFSPLQIVGFPMRRLNKFMSLKLLDDADQIMF